MSQIGSNIYPNTLFPDSIQALPQFANLTNDDTAHYIAYLQAIIAGNLDNANYHLSLINPDALVNAMKLNTLSDTIGAIQDLYGSTTTFSDIVNEKQTEWEEILAKFSYVGEWQEPRIYNSDISFMEGEIVWYGNAVWKCKIDNTVNQIPQEGVYWTQYYVKNSMVSFTDTTTNRDALYIALQNISIRDTPYESYTSENPQWFRLTLIGIVGDNGDGFSFEGEWKNTLSYSIGDLVTYDEICYSSLTNNNLNHTPNVNPTYWKHEFAITMKQIPIQKEMPVGQRIGELWFEVITE